MARVLPPATDWIADIRKEVEWVPNPQRSPDPADAPVITSDDKIQRLTSYIPFAPAANYTSANLAHMGVVSWIIKILQDVKCCPAGLENVIRQVIKLHESSLAVPGTPIGTGTAEALAAPITQMTLNTFHSSGSAVSASSGIEKIRDLIFAVQDLKHESCTVFFQDTTISYEDARDLRQYIVGSTFGQFVKAYDISDPQILKRHIDSPETLESYRPYVWQSGIFQDITPPPATRVMRLYLNTAEMFKYRVTAGDLAEVLDRETDSSVIVVYGTSEGETIMDLYPTPDMLQEARAKIEGKIFIPDELAAQYFFEVIVRPQLNNIRVKGIPRITQVYPIVYKVINAIDKEIPEFGDRVIWTVTIKPSIKKQYGLTGMNLARLAAAAGLIVVDTQEDQVRVEIPWENLTTVSGEAVTLFGDKWYTSLTAKIEGNTAWQAVIAKSTPLGWLETTDTTITVPIGDERITILPQDATPYIQLDTVVTIDDEKYERIGLGNEVYYRLVPTDLRVIQGTVFFAADVNDLIVKDNVIHLRTKVGFRNVLGQTRIVEGKLERQIDAVIIADKAYRPYLGKVKSPKPSQILEARITAAEDKLLYEWSKPGADITAVDRGELVRASELIYIKTEGQNLREVLMLPFVDKTRTICDNMHVVAEVLGIEAARKYIIQALDQTIKENGSYTNPSNLQTIAEFITNRGYPYGANFTGISRQAGGVFMSLATVERAGQVLATSALHSASESANNVSAAITMGARMKLGTGYFDITQVVNGKTIINDQLFDTSLYSDKWKQLEEQEVIGLPQQAPAGFNYAPGEEGEAATGATVDLDEQLLYFERAAAGVPLDTLVDIAVRPMGATGVIVPREVRNIGPGIKYQVPTMEKFVVALNALNDLLPGYTLA